MRNILIIIISICMIILMCSCNRVGMFVDTNNQANWAEVRHFNGDVCVYKINRWSQDEEGYTLILENGDVIYINGMNCILTKNKPEESIGKFVDKE